MGDRLNARQKGFKKAVDAEEAKKKREDAQVQLRKQEKEEALFKKRGVNDVPSAAGANPFQVPAAGSDENAMGTDIVPQQHSQQLEQMPAMVAALQSNDPEAVYNATQQFRRMLSIETNPPITEVITHGIVPRFVALLKEESRPMLQFEAAWVLTNIASGNADQTRVVVEHGALPLFVILLQSPNEDVREQAVWALGNIAGDCPHFRDLVLQSGGLNPIMRILGETSRVSLMRNATWTLSNLCRGKPAPPLEWVTPALPTFAQLINSTDVEVLTDACWALSYLSDGANDRITAVINSGVCQRLVDLLGHQSPLVQTPALRTVGNIVTGNDQQTSAMMQCGVLGPLMQLLSHLKKSIRKESCWTISNITAGNKEQIQEVIAHGLFPPVIHLLATADAEIKKEAAWAISNATAGGNPAQIEYLVECQCIKPLCDLLTTSDQKMIAVALDALENILRTGQQQQEEKGLPDNPIVALVEAEQGLARIENLQEDPNEEIYQRAVRLLETYFPLEDGGEAFSMPAGAGGFGAGLPQGGFNFGT
jgi:importin subunit alpha-1